MGYTPHILVLGGGVTGTAIARDFAIRGLDVTLVEQGTLTDGATGRMHGLLYSGARHAVGQPELAKRCLRESRILRRIASHCIEPADGLLVSHAADDENRFDELVSACEDCAIPAEELSGTKARRREPTLDDDVERALEVPDAVVDPFRLTVATAWGAMEHDASIRTHTTAVDLVVEDGAVVGALVCPTDELSDVTDVQAALEETPTDEVVEEAFDISREEEEDDDGPKPDLSDKQVPGTVETDSRDGRQDYGDEQVPGGSERTEDDADTGDEDGIDPEHVEAIKADYVVNATGGWADRIGEMADVNVPLEYRRSAMVVSGATPEHVVTRIRERPDANTVVPQGDSAILGATFEPAEGPDDLEGTQAEIDRLLADLGELLPAVETGRTLRAYWGVRVWPDTDGTTDGQPWESPGVLLDHSERDGRWGLITVVGGTLTTHRLLAERVVDDVCVRFGIDRPCRTDEMRLPGSDEQSDLDEAVADFGLPSPMAKQSRDRLGSRAKQVLETEEPNPIVCRCQGVTQAEIKDALDDETGQQPDLHEARIRTWASMGECQGGICAHRMATLLYPDYDTETVEAALDDLYEERWKGQRQTLYGEQLAQAMRNYRYHVSTLNRGVDRTTIDIGAFDDGPDWDDEGEPIRGGARP